MNLARIRVHYTFKRLICIADPSRFFTATQDSRAEICDTGEGLSDWAYTWPKQGLCLFYTSRAFDDKQCLTYAKKTEPGEKLARMDQSQTRFVRQLDPLFERAIGMRLAKEFRVGDRVHEASGGALAAVPISILQDQQTPARAQDADDWGIRSSVAGSGSNLARR